MTNHSATLPPLTKRTVTLKDYMIQHEFLKFRAFVQFKSTHEKRWFYGNEHSVTIDQVIAGYANSFELDRRQGFTALVHLITKTYKTLLSTAVIYQRSEETGKFDIELCRYYKGKLERQDKDLIAEILYGAPDVLRIYFHGIEKPFRPKFSLVPVEPLPDFALEIQKAIDNQKNIAV